MVTLPLWVCVAAALALILALTCVRVYRAVDADARLALSFAVVAVVMLLFAWRMVWLMRNGVVDSR
jgi:multisubunit Na+/H+ antiporter MnhB subunit